MSFRKLSPDSGSVSVRLPKKKLREQGVVNEDGDLDGEHWAKVEETGDGEFTIDILNL